MKRPLQLAFELAEHYGHVLERPVVYTQGVSLSGRLRLHDLVGGENDPAPEIAELVRDYVANPQSVFDITDGTANYAGVCWADELANATGDDAYLELLQSTADKFGPTVEEGPLDPDIRVEDFFFASTVLGRTYLATGENRYIDLLAEFLLTADTLQENGLWWHCKASPYFWGRGNAFAALGFAEALTYLPEDHHAREQLLHTHLLHLEGLVDHQDESGMWHQVVNLPETYLEFSASAMIGYALARGLREGWLDQEWRPILDNTWRGVSNRIGNAGELEHVCVGTGPLESLEAYINRDYTDGQDDRGGAMALWYSVEMARLEAGV